MQTRPYIGVVFEYNGFNYFAPLASPKVKHKTINSDAADIFKIDEGELGIININNMIPTPKFCLNEALPLIKDNTYKFLLKKQLRYINNNRNALFSKITKFYTQYRKGHLSSKILSRTCNFTLLEEKCMEYTNKLYVES